MGSTISSVIKSGDESEVELAEYSAVATTDVELADGSFSKRGKNDPFSGPADEVKKKPTVARKAFCLITYVVVLMFVGSVATGRIELPGYNQIVGKEKSVTYAPYLHDADASSYCFHMEERPLPTSLKSLIGETNITVTSNIEAAVKYAKQGFLLFYGYNGEEAIKYFRKAISLDPTMALAYYGIALTIGSNINFNMDPLCGTYALKYIRLAAQLSSLGGISPNAAPVSLVEQDLIAALVVRYPNTTADMPVSASPLPSTSTNGDGSAATTATDAPFLYFNAIKVAYTKYETYNFNFNERRGGQGWNSFADIASIYVDSMMELCSHQEGGMYAQDGTAHCSLVPEIIRVLENALTAFPNHVGLHHYYIHAVEGSTRPVRGLPSAEAIGALAPQNGHLVHMSSHIYQRLGMHEEAITASMNAIAADKSYRHACESSLYSPLCNLIYTGHYHPHNVAMLLWSYILTAQGSKALTTAESLPSFIEPYLHVLPSMEHDTANLYVTYDVFQQWKKALKTPLHAHASFAGTALWHFMRAKAFLGQDNHPAAHIEIERFEAFRVNATAAAADSSAGGPRRWGGGPLVKDLLSVASLELTAKHSAQEGKIDEGIELLKKGITIQDTFPYDEPIGWLPLRIRLGALYYSNGNYSTALSVFSELLTGRSDGYTSVLNDTQSAVDSVSAAAASPSKEHTIRELKKKKTPKAPPPSSDGDDDNKEGTVRPNVFPNNAFALLGVVSCLKKLDLPLQEEFYKQYQLVSNDVNGALNVEMMF